MRFLQKLPAGRTIEREAFLCQFVKDKRVLHVGCVDSGLLEDRLAEGHLLHETLAAEASEIWGLDVDGPGLEVLRKRGIERLCHGSGEDPPAELPRCYFDVVVAGEVIEHVRNPGLFIESAGNLLREGGALVLTTPNALRYYNPIPAIFGRELVHPRHLTWYSPHTLKETLRVNSFGLENLYFSACRPCVSLKSSSGPFGYLARVLSNLVIWCFHPIVVFICPHLADGLVAVARPASAKEPDRARKTP
jgi:2-polyprenyl-3-methyl-5-hydroxy-6-metoxy-1,4-benzoquinol methylase